MTQETSSTTPSGEYHYGTGRRKCAVARVRLYPGSGTIEINGRPYMDALPRKNLQEKARQPLEAAELADKFNVIAKINGGGVSGWADALAHGTARALVAYDEKLRTVMRKAGLLTRDPRVKERKKYGLKRARKAPQYTKR
ncbi:MAG TPA: 30S ribosomal protein S9 [Dehalococcoidia bacterium]|jgi:small subunit ribosomal protein S9|nr:30S ribosomal protein S9 [Dehalococcoidia bacterium]